MRRLISLFLAFAMLLTVARTGVAMAHEVGEPTEVAAHVEILHDHAAPAGDDHRQDRDGWGFHGHDASGHLQAISPPAVDVQARPDKAVLTPVASAGVLQILPHAIDHPPRSL